MLGMLVSQGTIAPELMVSWKMCEYFEGSLGKVKCYLSFCKKNILLL